MYFMAWTRVQAPCSAERIPNVYPTECFGGPYTFSQHLVNVEWTRQEAYHPLVVEHRHWEETERTYPLLVTWQITETPLGMSSSTQLQTVRADLSSDKHVAG